MNIESIISGLTGETVLGFRKLSSGGLFSHFVVRTEKQKFFVKTNSKKTFSFKKEVRGLRELDRVYHSFKKGGTFSVGQTGGITPRVVDFSDRFLVLSLIKATVPTDFFWNNLGVQLASIHKVKQAFFGFSEDNFIGQALQKNKWPPLKSVDSGQKDPGKIHSEDWPDFFWKNRIKHKLDSLEEKYGFQLSQKRFLKLRDKSLGLLSKHSCHPSLVHGDLWSGNILCDSRQKAFLIDPAVYWGDREVDLAMTECFGGFPPAFYRAYQKTYPLSGGYEKRKSLYNLFHILNHFVIFGPSYKQQSLGLIEEITCQVL